MEVEPGPVKKMKMKMKTEECGNPIDMDETCGGRKINTT